MHYTHPYISTQMNYIIKKQFLLLLEGYLQVDSIYRIFLTASVDVNSQSSFAIY